MDPISSDFFQRFILNTGVGKKQEPIHCTCNNFSLNHQSHTKIYKYVLRYIYVNY